MTQTLASANAPASVLAAAAGLASSRILAALLPVRPPRHRERRTKGRQQFPSSPATGRVPASTGEATITIYPAGQRVAGPGRTVAVLLDAAADLSMERHRQAEARPLPERPCGNTSAKQPGKGAWTNWPRTRRPPGPRRGS
jgi:hypothetical protein